MTKIEKASRVRTALFRMTIAVVGGPMCFGLVNLAVDARFHVTDFEWGAIVGIALARLQDAVEAWKS